MLHCLTVLLVGVLALLVAPEVRAGCIVGDPAHPAVVVLDQVPRFCCPGRWTGTIVGHVVNVETDSVYAVGWAWTNLIYVQPYIDRPYTVVNCDGTFRIATRGGHHYCVVIAKRSWKPDPRLVSLPPVGGEILAVVCSPPLRHLDLFHIEWEIKTSGFDRVGPGPNYFSDDEEHVWVDDRNRLHLRMTLNERGEPVCAEVVELGFANYGAYAAEFEAPFGPFDDCAVPAFFLYESDTRELDIEYSHWCGTVAQNAQFVVQPWWRTGNLHRFNLPPLTGKRTHLIRWLPGEVYFEIREGGLDENGQVLESWTYHGSDVPVPGKARVRFNLWSFQGRTVSGPQEFIVSGFRYTPDPIVGVEAKTWTQVKSLYR